MTFWSYDHMTSFIFIDFLNKSFSSVTDPCFTAWKHLDFPLLNLNIQLAVRWLKILLAKSLWWQRKQKLQGTKTVTCWILNFSSENKIISHSQPQANREPISTIMQGGVLQVNLEFGARTALAEARVGLSSNRVHYLTKVEQISRSIWYFWESWRRNLIWRKLLIRQILYSATRYDGHSRIHHDIWYDTWYLSMYLKRSIATFSHCRLTTEVLIGLLVLKGLSKFLSWQTKLLSWQTNQETSLNTQYCQVFQIWTQIVEMKSLQHL